MANMKDRMARAEARLDSRADQRAIDEAAEQFDKMFNRLLDGLRPEDGAIALQERLSTMSVVQHAAWCVGFVPGFHMSQASLDQLLSLQQEHRRLGAI